MAAAAKKRFLKILSAESFLSFRHFLAANNAEDQRISEHGSAAVEAAGDFAYCIKARNCFAAPIEYFAIGCCGKSSFCVGAAGKKRNRKERRLFNGLQRALAACRDRRGNRR